jgi:multidrug resistance efflux pump
MLAMEKAEERLRTVEEQTAVIMRHVEACEALGKKAETDRTRMKAEFRWFTAMILIAVVPQFIGFVVHLLVSHPF